MDATGAARKSAAAEVGIQMPEAAKASAVAADSGTMSRPLVPVTGGKDHRAAAAMGWDAVAVGVRLATVLSSLLSLSILVTAEQRGASRYLVGILAAVAAHSLLQLLLSLRKLAQGSPVIPFRSHAWIIFAGTTADERTSDEILGKLEWLRRVIPDCLSPSNQGLEGRD
ncbi:CASP-like protein [Musa troglodytarum]|uniref:CASP-like protein n=1 Tax=Musa troglodytarum TaxID=320322 RepID=A0A9E7FJ66_9LILI|nr:CASP-like protein [Musa troglodytarum]